MERRRVLRGSPLFASTSRIGDAVIECLAEAVGEVVVSEARGFARIADEHALDQIRRDGGVAQLIVVAACIRPADLSADGAPVEPATAGTGPEVGLFLQARVGEATSTLGCCRNVILSRA